MSNPLQSPPTDAAELARLLADGDEPTPGPLDSTLAELRLQLETLTEQLRRPAPIDQFEEESACRRVVEAIGRDPSRSNVRTERAPLADSHAIPAELAQLGQYRLLAKLGQGGMGAVYKALHVRLDKVVAVKVLPQEVTQRADAVARFEREMRAVGKLQHPNIVAAHDAGEANGNHFLVMELVDGEDVGSLVRRRGPLPIAESCEIVRQAALGLQHAHEHGLVHRDVKPSNLMVASSERRAEARGQRSEVSIQTPDTRHQALRSPLTTHHSATTVKILDMGLALLDESQREAVGELTSTGQIMGTLDYMAPEQGADTHTVDIRADVYSLGATLYKLLCGHAPFEGPKYSTQIKKLTALATVEPERIENLRPDVPHELAELVHRMLSKTPAARPTPPAEVARLMVPFAAGADLASLLGPATLPTRDPKGAAAAVAETATDPTFIAETNVTQPASWDGPPGPSTPPSPLSRADRSRPETPAIAGEGPGVREQTHASSPPSSILHPQSSSSPPPRRRFLLRYAAFSAPLLIGLALIVIQTKQGTVTVKTSEKLPDAVTIAVKQGGEVVEILDKNNEWKVRVKAGEYELEIHGGKEEFKLEEDENGVSRLGVSRWGTTFVEVTPDPRPPEPTHLPTNFALQFDGVDDYVDLPTLSFPGDSPWTVECWYRRPADATRVTGNLLSYAGGLRLFPSGKQYLHWGVRTSTPPHHWREEHIWPLDPGAGVAVALTFDGTKLRLFADGLLQKEWDAPDVELMPLDPDWGNAGAIGALISPWRQEPDPDTHFGGQIDELRISTIARYTLDYPLESRLPADEHTSALYHFDEGQGDVLTDASGNGHHGKIKGATWVKAGATQSDQPRDFALSFDGVDDGVEIPTLTADGHPQLTVECYVRPRDAAGSGRIIMMRGPTPMGLIVRHGEWVANTFRNGTGHGLKSAIDGEISRPVHLASVWDGKALRLYVDGRSNSHSYGTSAHAVDRAFTQLGGPPAYVGVEPATQWLNGTLDEVHISATARYTDDFTPAARFEPDEHTLALYHFDEGEGDVLRDASGNGHDGKIVGATWVPVDAGPSPRSRDLDRELAQWALDQGVAVHIVELAELPVGTELYRLAPEAFYAMQFNVTSLPLRLVTQRGELPAGPFVVVGIAHAHGREWHEGLRLTADDIRRLGGLQHLQYLSMIAADSAAAAALDSLQQLRILSLDLGQANGGLRTLRNLPELVYLEVHHAGNAAVPEIAAIPALRVLSLMKSGIALNDAGLEALAETRLESLSISQADVAGPGFAHLKSVESLRQLSLNTVHPSAIDSLSELPQLQSLHLARLLDDGRLLKLADLPNLRQVTFYPADGLTDAGLAAFRAARPDCELLYMADELPAPANYALQFDGDGDVVHVAGFHPPIDQPITFECRVTLTEGVDHRQANLLVTPLGGLKVNPDNRWSMLVWDRGNERAALSLIATQPIETGREYHVAASWDGRSYRLFIDGRLVAEKPLSEIPAAAAGEPVAIGGYPDGATGIAEAVLHGIVDEVRISSVARYAADFKPEPRLQLDAETLALYHFDEGQGDVLTDASGNNHHGTIVGAAWVTSLNSKSARAVAEWVFSHQGKVWIKLPDESEVRLAAAPDELPDEAWQLYGVDLSYTQVPNDEVDKLRGLTSLRDLNLDTAYQFGDAGMTHLEGLPLTALNLRGTQITDAGLRHLRGMTQLVVLAVPQTAVTDAGMADIAPLTDLERLILHNTQIGDAGLARLQGLTKLRSLEVYNTPLTDTALETIAGFTALELLQLTGTRVTDVGISRLAPLKQLRHLSVSGTGVSDAALSAIVAVPLDWLSLNNTQITDAGLEHLAESTTLSELHITQTSVTDAGVQRLRESRPALRIVSDFGTFEPAAEPSSD